MYSIPALSSFGTKETKMRQTRLLAVLSSVAIALSSGGIVMAQTQTKSTSDKKTIVLVHGAFADASGWSKLIPILESDGYYVTAVQIPLTSLADDVATTKRVLDAQKGPAVLVGPSVGRPGVTPPARGRP